MNGYTTKLVLFNFLIMENHEIFTSRKELYDT
jgi:hypothetical protein